MRPRDVRSSIYTLAVVQSCVRYTLIFVIQLFISDEEGWRISISPWKEGEEKGGGRGRSSLFVETIIPKCARSETLLVTRTSRAPICLSESIGCMYSRLERKTHVLHVLRGTYPAVHNCIRASGRERVPRMLRGARRRTVRTRAYERVKCRRYSCLPPSLGLARISPILRQLIFFDAQDRRNELFSFPLGYYTRNNNRRWRITLRFRSAFDPASASVSITRYIN